MHGDHELALGWIFQECGTEASPESVSVRPNVPGWDIHGPVTSGTTAGRSGPDANLDGN